jgi:hypothetical protein
MATQGNNVAAAIFWMKARCGWSERQQLEVTGRGGMPIATVSLTEGDPDSATQAYMLMINGGV